MSEERKARLRIVSKMTDPEGDVHTTKNARSGVFRRTADGLVLEYDDEQDGERAHIVLTADGGRARMHRRGMMSGVLTFLPGERVAGSYVSMYGEIPVAVSTRRVRLSEQENGGVLLLDYDVYVSGERTSSAELEVTWRL